MSEWKRIDTTEPPKDRLLILFGELDGQAVTDEHPKGAIRVIGYWDPIDEAWALSDTSWLGPFIIPTHWMLCPDRP